MFQSTTAHNKNQRNFFNNNSSQEDVKNSQPQKIFRTGFDGPAPIDFVTQLHPDTESVQLAANEKDEELQMKSSPLKEEETLQKKSDEQQTNSSETIQKKGKEVVPDFDASAFSPKEVKQIRKAMIASYTMTNKAISKVDKNGSHYKRWMDSGKVDPANADARATHVKTGLESVEKCLREDEITMKDYELTDGEKDTTFAYVMPSEIDNNIYLGGAFWKAKVKGSDSKAGTIIHELTHRLHGTSDHVYGQEDAKILAKTEPDKATTNADNYEYFAEKS